ncbi:hypothetical protein VNO77_17631 [Canavalia gladiata]|uniref:Uncharacterized protein n=1 Tax=Canavalia gladiata TaxID=3824 RepID=A0AAN9LN41_CANGL
MVPPVGLIGVCEIYFAVVNREEIKEVADGEKRSREGKDFRTLTVRVKGFTFLSLLLQLRFGILELRFGELKEEVIGFVWEPFLDYN